VSRLVRLSEYPFWFSFHHEQNRVPQILYRMEQRTLAHAADMDLTKRLAQKKLVISGYGYWCAKGPGPCVEAAVPVKCMNRAMKQTFMCKKAAPGGGKIVDICEHLTTAKYHGCKRRTEAGCDEDGNSKRSVDRNLFPVLDMNSIQPEAAESGVSRCNGHPSTADNGARWARERSY
jgi:hypothetical protein